MIYKEILDFLTGLHGDRNNTQKRKAIIHERAFINAFKDMSTHTVAYVGDFRNLYIDSLSKRCDENRQKIRSTMMGCVVPLFEQIENGTIAKEEDFNHWHKKCCDYIVNNLGSVCKVVGLKDKKGVAKDLFLKEIYRHTDEKINTVFSYGQAQKLINMMLKYLYIYFACEGWNSLQSVYVHFHAPLDSFVLKAVFLIDKYNGQSWSKITDYSTYMQCQKEIHKYTDNKGYSTPFMWELTEWPFELI